MKNALLLFAFLLISSTLRAQWVTQPVPFSKPTLLPGSLQAVDAHMAWAIGLNLDIFSGQGLGSQEVARTTDGRTWQTFRVAALGPHDSLSSISAQSAGTALVTTTGSLRNQVLRTTDGGATWQTLLAVPAPATGASFDYVHFFDNQHGVCIGDPGAGSRFMVYTTADGGTTWLENTTLPPTTGPSDEYLTQNAPPVALGSQLWLATTASRVFHSADQGLTWTVSEVVPGQRPGFNGPHLAFESATTGLAVYSRQDGLTSQQPLFRTTDGGATWQPASFSGPLHGANVAWVPGTNAYLSVGFNLPVAGVPADAGSAISRDEGATWQALESTDDHLLLSAAGPLAIWTSSYDFNTLTSNGVRKLTATTLPTRAAAAAPPLEVFPQPSPDGRFRVQLPGASGGQLLVRDALGRLVRTQVLPGAATAALDLSGQPAGLYLLELRSAAGVAQARVLVQ